MELTRKYKHVAMILETQQAPRRRLLDGVARYMQEHEPWAIYLKPFGVDQSLENWLQNWQGDGILAVITESTADTFASIDIPVVDLIGVKDRPGIPIVRTDHRSVGRLAAEHLLERGFRELCYVGYPEHAWAVSRFDAYREVARAHNINCQEFQVRYPSRGTSGPDAWELQQKQISDWLNSIPKPAGVFCCTDLLSQQFLEACLRVGVAVPEQIAVVGADNDEPICNLCFPPLSSVVINDVQRGYAAAAVLDSLMNGKGASRTPVLVDPLGVITRASTDIMAVEDELVADSLRYIRDQACSGISALDVVRRVPLSRSLVEKRFRMFTGRTINAEIVRVRLNHAVKLLTETNLAPKLIAAKAGFRSISYMNTVFRDKLKRTPGSYRKRFKERFG